tara:strand:- start:54 stop:653 length:600 start_codon:yes stop_codon:yes gene_type:complete
MKKTKPLLAKVLTGPKAPLRALGGRGTPLLRDPKKLEVHGHEISQGVLSASGELRQDAIRMTEDLIDILRGKVARTDLSVRKLKATDLPARMTEGMTKKEVNAQLKQMNLQRKRQRVFNVSQIRHKTDRGTVRADLNSPAIWDALGVLEEQRTIGGKSGMRTRDNMSAGLNLLASLLPMAVLPGVAAAFLTSQTPQQDM